MLFIKNVSKKYGAKLILNDVTLSVAPGSIALLLGQSGVGKSTLLRILSGLEKADAGTVSLDGASINQAQSRSEHTVGLVFQNFNLFDHLTVEENITLPLTLIAKKNSAAAHDIAHQLLARYGLADKAEKYPSQLSGGQKQRLAIARTLALKPRIVCLDEPTSALDPLLTSTVARTIQDLAHEGYYVLVASHDIGLLEKLRCMIYLMHDGRIIEHADSADLAQHKERYPLIKRFIEGSNE